MEREGGRVKERENEKVLVKNRVFRVSKGEEQERESEVAIAACFIGFCVYVPSA